MQEPIPFDPGNFDRDVYNHWCKYSNSTHSKEFYVKGKMKYETKWSRLRRVPHVSRFSKRGIP